MNKIIIITVFLVLLPFYFYLKYTDTTYNNYAPIEGLDILSDCKTKPDVSAMMTITEDSLNIFTTIAITNYEKIKNECNFIKYFIPGKIKSLSYQIIQTNVQKIDKNFKLEKPKYINITSFKRDPFGYDIITINLNKYPKYSGIVNFQWENELEKTSYGSRHINIPLFSQTNNINDDNNYTKLKNFHFFFNIPSGTIVKNLSHNPKNKLGLGKRIWYDFTIDKNNTIFEVDLDFPKLLKWQNIIINISLLFLGAGLALLIEILINYLSFKKKKKSKKKVKKKR